MYSSSGSSSNNNNNNNKSSKLIPSIRRNISTPSNAGASSSILRSPRTLKSTASSSSSSMNNSSTYCGEQPQPPNMVDETQIQELVNVLEKTRAEDWTKRCNAFQTLVDYIPSPEDWDLYDANQYWFNSPKTLRHLAWPIGALLKDARSTVVKRSAECCTQLFIKVRGDGRYLLKDLQSYIIAVQQQTVLVIRQNINAMMEQVLKVVPCKAAMPLWLERLKLDKSRTVRESCAYYLRLALEYWQDWDNTSAGVTSGNGASPYLTSDIYTQVGTLLIRVLRDPSPAVREQVRDGLEVIRTAQPDIWKAFLDDPFGPAAKDAKLLKFLQRMSTPGDHANCDELSMSSRRSGNSLTSRDSRASVRSAPAFSSITVKNKGGGGGGTPGSTKSKRSIKHKDQREKDAKYPSRATSVTGGGLGPPQRVVAIPSTVDRNTSDSSDVTMPFSLTVGRGMKSSQTGGGTPLMKHRITGPSLHHLTGSSDNNNNNNSSSVPHHRRPTSSSLGQYNGGGSSSGGRSVMQSTATNLFATATTSAADALRMAQDAVKRGASRRRLLGGGGGSSTTSTSSTPKRGSASSRVTPISSAILGYSNRSASSLMSATAEDDKTTATLVTAAAEQQQQEPNVGGDGTAAAAGGVSPFVLGMEELKKRARNSRSRRSSFMQERWKAAHQQQQSSSKSSLLKQPSDASLLIDDIDGRSSHGPSSGSSRAMLTVDAATGAKKASSTSSLIVPEDAAVLDSMTTTAATGETALEDDEQQDEHVGIAHQLLEAHRRHIDHLMTVLRAEMDTLVSFESSLVEIPHEVTEEDVLDYFESVGMCLEERNRISNDLQQVMDTISGFGHNNNKDDDDDDVVKGETADDGDADAANEPVTTTNRDESGPAEATVDELGATTATATANDDDDSNHDSYATIDEDDV